MPRTQRRCRSARFIRYSSPFGRWAVKIEADEAGSWESTIVRVKKANGASKRLVLSVCLEHEGNIGIYAIQGRA